MKTVVVCDVDGTMTDGYVYVDSEGREGLRFSKRDGWLLDEARVAGIEVVMVTDDTNPEPAIARARKLGLDYVATATAGFSFHDFPEERAAAMHAFRDAKPLTKRGLVALYKSAGFRVVYIGDAPADLEAMREADEAWCPNDAALGTAAVWMTDHRLVDGGDSHRDAYKLDAKQVVVAHAMGGHGVLHEVLGYLLAEKR